MKGRKPKPTNLKLVQGNPGKRPMNENEAKPEILDPDEIKCPEYLDEVAAKKFMERAPILARLGLLTEIDVELLAMWCSSYSTMVDAENNILEYGRVVKSPNTKFPIQSPYLAILNKAHEKMQKLGAELGQNAPARSRITVPTGDLDEMEKFLQRGQRT